MKRAVLIMIRDPDLRNGLSCELRREGREVQARHFSEGWSVLAADANVGALLVGEDLLDGDGNMILRKAQGMRPDLFLALIQKRGEAEYVAIMNEQEQSEIHATALGEWLCGRLTDVEARQAEVPLAKRERVDLEDEGFIDTENDDMKRILDVIEKVAPTEATVLLQGESGTGKDLLAHRIHKRSARAKEPLVEVHCGAIPPALMESELFGHEKGSFTGATARKTGLFLAAECGTLFLDEIGELPLDMQVKLLRVLQSGWMRPIGSTHSIKVDVRVIAATNRDLKKEVVDGKFRLDLFYRLNVIGIHVPPLRERPQDILVLIRSMLGRFSRKAAAPVELPPAVLEVLLAYQWPGNVRELENVMERILLLYPDGNMPLAELKTMLIEGSVVVCAGPVPAAGAPAFSPERIQEAGGYSEAMTLDELESLHIRRALKRCQGNMTQAARALGINVKTLYNKMKAGGLRREEFFEYS